MLTRTNPNPNPNPSSNPNPNPNPNPPNPNQGWTLGTCMEYAASSNSTLLSPSIDFVKPLVSEYLTADQSYVNGVFDTYFVPSAASGSLPSLYFTMAMHAHYGYGRAYYCRSAALAMLTATMPTTVTLC